MHSLHAYLPNEFMSRKRHCRRVCSFRATFVARILIRKIYALVETSSQAAWSRMKRLTRHLRIPWVESTRGWQADVRLSLSGLCHRVRKGRRIKRISKGYHASFFSRLLDFSLYSRLSITLLHLRFIAVCHHGQGCLKQDYITDASFARLISASNWIEEDFALRLVDLRGNR